MGVLLVCDGYCAQTDRSANGKRLGTYVVETNGQALVERLKTIPGTLHVCMAEGTFLAVPAAVSIENPFSTA